MRRCSTAECKSAEDYRCEVAGCPDRIDPVENLLESIKRNQADFTQELASLSAAMKQVEKELSAPKAFSLSHIAPTVGAILTYLGLLGFIMAHVYLRSYYYVLIGRTSVSPTYLETIVAPWQTLQTAFFMIALAAGFWISASLILSTPTRWSLWRCHQSAVLLNRRAHETAVKSAKLKPIVENAMESIQEDNSALTKLEDVKAFLDEVDAIASEQQEMANRHQKHVEYVARLSSGVWIGLRLKSFKHQSLIVVAMILGILVLLGALSCSIIAFSGTVPWASRSVAGLVTFVVAMLCVFWCWLMISYADFANGPGATRSRVVTAFVALFALVASLAAFSGLGRADGTYARLHPDRHFDWVQAGTTAGEVHEGYLLPVVGTHDTFLMTNDEVLRLPQNQVRVIRTELPEK